MGSSWKTVNGQLHAKGVKMHPVTKPGKHGTLTLYRIVYWMDHDDMRPDEVARIWAYSAEHAEEKFRESCADQGYDDVTIKALERVMEA